MAKGVKKKSRELTKKGVGALQSVVAEALGAAATTAAGVVLTRVAEGMSSGANKIEQKSPANNKVNERVKKPVAKEKSPGRKAKASKKKNRKKARR